MPWLARKAIQLSSPVFTYQHYTDDAGIAHIDIEMTSVGGIKGKPDRRALDGSAVECEGPFGPVIGLCIPSSSARHPCMPEPRSGVRSIGDRGHC